MFTGDEYILTESRRENLALQRGEGVNLAL